MHVHGLYTLRLDVVGDNPEYGAVVSLDGNLGLLVAQLFEELAHRYSWSVPPQLGVWFPHVPSGYTLA